MEKWICTNCGLILLIGCNMVSEIPRSCAACGNRAWDIVGSPDFCRAAKDHKHEWSRGVNKFGLPNMDPDQHCRACGAMPVVEGVNAS